MNKPLILIPTPVQDEQRRSFSMGKSYINSLIAAGGVPVMVPVTINESELRELYDYSDGVMLAGGGDIDPSEYGESRHEKTQGIDPNRDHTEFTIARWAVAEDKPLFGICRGIQALNVAMGGSLIQDIPSHWLSDLRHNGHYEKASRDEVLHVVSVEPGSQVERMVNQRQVGVNSFHHQSVKRLADGLVATSTAPDGIIEAVEMPGKQFVVSVQWHPEEMSSTRQDMLNLFVVFVAASANAGKKSGRL